MQLHINFEKKIFMHIFDIDLYRELFYRVQLPY
jgi:hypothetical protein